MPASADRRRERELLRADQKWLSQLLRRIAADTKAARELAASVQRRLAEELEEQRRAAAAAEEEEEGTIDPELARMLASVDRLRLQLLLEPDGGRAAIDLPLDATVADLQTAVRSAGGPVPPLQVLAVGGERLMHLGRTLLRDTRLIRQDVCVTVRRRDPRRRCVDMSRKGTRSGKVCIATVAHLESGEMWCSVDAVGGGRVDVGDVCECGDGDVHGDGDDEATSSFSFGLSNVESVYSDDRFVAAIADGTLHVWSHRRMPDAVTALLRRLRGEKVVSFVLASPKEFWCPDGSRGEVAAVDGSGQLIAANGDQSAVCFGGVAAVSVTHTTRQLVVLTRDGELCIGSTTWDAHQFSRADLGGRAAVAVSAGSSHCAALLDDGSVRCFGRDEHNQCDVPSGLRDVVSVECGPGCSFALRADGRLSCWGSWAAPRRPTDDDDSSDDEDVRSINALSASLPSGRFVAVAAEWYSLLTVSADGRLARHRYSDGEEEPLPGLPSDRVAAF